MRTIPALWHAAVDGSRSYPAFLVEERGGWRAVGWEEAGQAVDELAAGFLSLGIEQGERVAILGRTRLEWTLCDYSLASIGAVTVPVYPTSSTLECAYILGNAGARAIVCEDEQHYATVAPVRSELFALDHVVAMEGRPSGAVDLTELRERGRSFSEARPRAIEERRAGVGEDDLLTIIYTSGTTGPPKGCMLTHRHFWAMVDMLRRLEGFWGEEDRVLLYLPLAHNFARLVQYGGAGVGFTIGLCSDISSVPEALAAVRPTILPSVPRLFEKVQGSVEARFAETKGPRRKLGDWALSVGRRSAAERSRGVAPSRALALQRSLADRLVFAKVKQRLGGRLRFAVSGGAPLSREVAEYFDALGILILEGYGLTECTTASHVNVPGAFRFGTVGRPFPGIEVRIEEDGEVLLRGETVFAGYYGDERATREALTEDGWLRTGDIGSVDSDGFLTITDRKKDIIITAGGKNVAPQPIENAIKTARIVSNALVVGNRRPYVVALVTLDREEIARSGSSAADVQTVVEGSVEEANRMLARPEQVKRFAVLPRDFLPEHGEVTPTLKLRRHICEEHFRDEIEALYEGGAESAP